MRRAFQIALCCAALLGPLAVARSSELSAEGVLDAQGVRRLRVETESRWRHVSLVQRVSLSRGERPDRLLELRYDPAPGAGTLRLDDAGLAALSVRMGRAQGGLSFDGELDWRRGRGWGGLFSLGMEAGAAAWLAESRWRGGAFAGLDLSARRDWRAEGGALAGQLSLTPAGWEAGELELTLPLAPVRWSGDWRWEGGALAAQTLAFEPLDASAWAVAGELRLQSRAGAELQLDARLDLGQTALHARLDLEHEAPPEGRLRWQARRGAVRLETGWRLTARGWYVDAVEFEARTGPIAWDARFRFGRGGFQGVRVAAELDVWGLALGATVRFGAGGVGGVEFAGGYAFPSA